MIEKRASQRGRRNVLGREERRVHDRGFECFKTKVSIASDRSFLIFVASPVLSIG